MEVNQQGLTFHPNLNIGSRFRALVALDLNTVTEDHEIEVVAGKDSTSILETNSNLVGIEQADLQEAGAR